MTCAGRARTVESTKKRLSKIQLKTNPPGRARPLQLGAFRSKKIPNGVLVVKTHMFDDRAGVLTGSKKGVYSRWNKIKHA